MTTIVFTARCYRAHFLSPSGNHDTSYDIQGKGTKGLSLLYSFVFMLLYFSYLYCCSTVYSNTISSRPMNIDQIVKAEIPGQNCFKTGSFKILKVFRQELKNSVCGLILYWIPKRIFLDLSFLSPKQTASCIERRLM